MALSGSGMKQDINQKEGKRMDNQEVQCPEDSQESTEYHEAGRLEAGGNNILHTFNSFFGGAAKAEIKGNRLEITIGSRTLLISLPEIVGAQSTGPS